MKTIMITCVLCIVGTLSMAQYDPEARAVLDAMSEKYRKTSSYSANITNSMINESAGINEEFKGKITVKGDKFKLEMDDQTVINDGNTVWTYLPDVNEVNIDTYDPAEDEISPSSIYDAYKDGYKYIKMPSEKCGTGNCAVIDLVPNDRDKQFFKIKLFIDESNYSLKSWTMFEKSGNQYRYEIKNFNDKITVPDSAFTFDATKYPGVEVIDLR